MMWPMKGWVKGPQIVFDETYELLCRHRPELADKWLDLRCMPLSHVGDWLKDKFPGVINDVTLCHQVPDLLAEHFAASDER